MATTDDATYWLIAIPNWAASGRAPRQGSSKTERELDEERILTRRELDMKTGKMGALYTFHLPKLRVGTLDSLMTLTDELHKLDAQIFQTVRRVQTLYGDLKGEAEDLLVNAMSCERYAENFAWNEALYRVTLPLPELKQRIEMDMNAIADELHKKTGKFADVQQELSALERKQTGSLLVKPLGPLVPPEKLVEGAFLSTLLVVVPVAKRKDFLASYELLEEMAAKRHRERVEALRESGVEEEPVNPLEQLELSDAEDEAAPGEGDAGDDAEQEDPAVEAAAAERQAEAAAARERRALKRDRYAKVRNVVPRSAEQLAQDSEFVLFRIVVFKKGATVIKNLCRERRWTVREYHHDPEEVENDNDRKVELTNKKSRMMGSLIKWLENQYSHVFEAWMHIKAIRVFAESVLRFGIPVNIQAVLIKPRKGYRTKLRRALEELYARLAGPQLTAGGESNANEAEMAGLGGGEFYPYVYIPVALDE